MTWLLRGRDHSTSGRKTTRLPEGRRGEAGPFHHGLKLSPGDLGIDLATPGGRAKATISAGNDPLPPHHLGIAHNPFGHQFRVLNEVGRTIQDPWDDDLIIR